MVSQMFQTAYYLCIPIHATAEIFRVDKISIQAKKSRPESFLDILLMIENLGLITSSLIRLNIIFV